MKCKYILFISLIIIFSFTKFIYYLDACILYRGGIMTGYVGHVEKQTLSNNYFRKVLFTGKNSQLVLMSLKPLEEIGNEVHPHVDQFFRIEAGEAKFVLNNKEKHIAKDGDAVIVPAGTWHNIINNSKTKSLKLYTIYSPPNHPDGTIHKTKADADKAELDEHK